MDPFRSLCKFLVEEGKVRPEDLLREITKMYEIKAVPAIFSKYGGALTLRPLVYEYVTLNGMSIDLNNRIDLVHIYYAFQEWVTKIKYPTSTGALKLYEELRPLYLKVESRFVGTHKKRSEKR